MSVKQVFNTSAELDYPTVLPTLDLDFANSKTLDPRITFTRASGGSYVGADGLIKLAGVNEARFDHDPVTGESLGLLVEESRSNLTTYSEDFTNAAWILFGTTSRSPNTVTAPDGNTTADTVTLPISSGIYQFTSASANTTYTFSVWLRSPSASQNVNIVLNTNLSDPTQLTVTATTTWQRFSVTKTTSVGTTTLTSQLSSGVGNTFYVWGAQTETGAFATSYIPTEGSTRTRAADNASMTGKNFSEWYRQDEGTIYSNITLNDKIPFSQNNVFYSLNDGSQSNRITLFAGNDSASLTGRYSVSGVLSSPILTSLTSLKNIKTTFSFQSNNIILLDNQRTSNLFPSGYPTANRLELGNQNTAQLLNGTIARITYYPKRLPNSQLISLTS